MPGTPFTVADSQDLHSTPCMTPAAAVRTFGRRPEEVPPHVDVIDDGWSGLLH